MESDLHGRVVFIFGVLAAKMSLGLIFLLHLNQLLDGQILRADGRLRK